MAEYGSILVGFFYCNLLLRLRVGGWCLGWRRGDWWGLLVILHRRSLGRGGKVSDLYPSRSRLIRSPRLIRWSSIFGLFLSIYAVSDPSLNELGSNRHSGLTRDRVRGRNPLVCRASLNGLFCVDRRPRFVSRRGSGLTGFSRCSRFPVWKRCLGLF